MYAGSQSVFQKNFVGARSAGNIRDGRVGHAEWAECRLQNGQGELEISSVKGQVHYQNKARALIEKKAKSCESKVF